VNRGHPFVNAYLSLPAALRAGAQRTVKASAAEAHPLIGACNTPGQVRSGLRDAGYGSIQLVTTDHLARAWRHTLPTWALGLAGDMAAHTMPARRSTIVARGQRPAAAQLAADQISTELQS
jgi:hypothetical protein